MFVQAGHALSTYYQRLGLLPVVKPPLPKDRAAIVPRPSALTFPEITSSAHLKPLRPSVVTQLLSVLYIRPWLGLHPNVLTHLTKWQSQQAILPPPDRTLMKLVTTLRKRKDELRPAMRDTNHIQLEMPQWLRSEIRYAFTNHNWPGGLKLTSAHE